MGHRLQRLVTEATRFLAVGGVATLVALVIFNVLVHGLPGQPGGPMHGWPLSSFVLANLVAMTVSYRGSRSWAFRHREAVGVAGGRVAFAAITTLSLGVPLACLAVSRYVLHLDSGLSDNIAANVVGLGLGTAARFWAFRKFIFVRPAKARAQQLSS